MITTETDRRRMNAYLAFLRREAEALTGLMGYRTDEGVLTPICATVNGLYPPIAEDRETAIRERSGIVLEALGVEEPERRKRA